MHAGYLKDSRPGSLGFPALDKSSGWGQKANEAVGQLTALDEVLREYSSGDGSRG